MTSMTRRISTGVTELDVVIDGGFRSGKTYLLLGEPGTGKTIFGLQFLFRGLLDNEKTIYVPINENPADIVEQAASLGWNLLPYIENKQCLLLRPSAYFSGDRLKKSDIEKIIQDLNRHIQDTGATRVVIDPVAHLLSVGDSNARGDDQARLLFNLLESNVETTTLLITHPAGRNVRAVEEYLGDGTIVLELELANDRFLRTLTVEKMRCTALAPAQYSFAILPERGVVLQSSPTDPLQKDPLTAPLVPPVRFFEA